MAFHRWWTGARAAVFGFALLGAACGGGSHAGVSADAGQPDADASATGRGGAGGGKPDGSAGGSSGDAGGSGGSAGAAGAGGSAAAGSGGGPSASRPARAGALVAGGTVMSSARYRLIGSMGPGVADGRVSASPRYELRGGLVGASQ